MLKSTAFAVLVSVVLAAAATADTLPEARTELVRLDAVVNDEHGTLLRDLQQSDFEILEDGKPQTVTLFLSGGRTAVVPAAPIATVPDVATATVPAPAETPGPAMGRSVLLVIDDLHIGVGGIDQTKRALRRLLDEVIAPNDPVGLVSTSPEGPRLAFTLEHARVQAAIDRLVTRTRGFSAARGSQMSPAEAELILAGDRGALELVGRKMVEEPGSLIDNAGPQAAVMGPDRAGASTAGLRDAKQHLAETLAKRQARSVLDEALAYSILSLRTIDNAMRSLAAMPGRKLCLLVSDGFPAGVGTSEARTFDLQKVIDAATRSGAVVYALDSRGLTTAAADASAVGGAIAPGLQVRVQRRAEEVVRNTLHTLADETGGFVVHDTNDLARGLRRMLEDNDAYYVLAYAPTNPARDGRFRKIDVRIAGHPAYKVRTRRGYLAPDDKNPRSPSKSVKPTALLDADVRVLLDKPAPAGTLRLGTDYLDLPPQALLRAHIDLSGVAWEKADGRRRASILLVGGVYDADGRPVGAAFARPWDLDLDSKEQKRAIADGLAYQRAVPLGPGRYQIRLAVRDGQGAVIGGAAEWIEIPDLAEKKLTLSSVFLSAGAEARQRFKRDESVSFQLYVYNLAKDDTGATDAVLQAQLRAADRVVAASKPQAVTVLEKDGVPVPQTNGMSLAGLAPGPYQLRVVVFDRKAAVSVSRDVLLTLE